MRFGSLNKQMKSGPKIVISVNFRKDVFWIGSPWFSSSQDKVPLRSYTLSTIWRAYIVRSYMNVCSCSCSCLVLHNNRTTDCLTSSYGFVPVHTHECWRTVKVHLHHCLRYLPDIPSMSFIKITGNDTRKLIIC